MYTVKLKDTTFVIMPRKHQKRIIFRATEANTYKVTCPYRTSKKALLKTIEQHHSHLNHLKPPLDIEGLLIENQNVPLFDEVVTLKTSNLKEIKALFKKRLETEIEWLINKYNPYFKTIDLSKITRRYRYLKSKFGSCKPSTLSITFNMELIHFPKVFLEYIFVHEIAHLVHQNHSKEFHLLTERLFTSPPKIKETLNHLHSTLHYEGFDALILVTKSLK